MKADFLCPLSFYHFSSPEKAEFYSFVRALDAAKIAFEEDDVLYLNEDSPLASLFTDGY